MSELLLERSALSKQLEQQVAVYQGRANILRRELERVKELKESSGEVAKHPVSHEWPSVKEKLASISEEYKGMRSRIREELALASSDIAHLIASLRAFDNPPRQQVSMGTLKADLAILRDQIRTLGSAGRDLMEGELWRAIRFISESRSSEIKDLREKLRLETATRRKLHNTVLELKGNIRVFVRIRPLLQSEIQAGASSCVDGVSDTDLSITCTSRSGNPVRVFSFDRVFGADVDNDALFAELQQLLISTMDGFNVSVIAYGITGSGKTFTMDGVYERVGIGLFTERADRERGGSWKYTLELSVSEVYNETVIDLLNLKNLNTSIKTNTSTGMFHIPGLTRVGIGSSADLSKAWSDAARNRSVSSTNCNQQSSRSHLITTIHVSITTPNGRNIESKMSLVDLAGSERIDKSGATGLVAKEGVHINKSLSALGDVINARINKASHVPFRNSVLTSTLQECISGESKTLVLLNVTPAQDSFEETSTSLIFGSRIREVETQRQSPNSPRKKYPA